MSPSSAPGRPLSGNFSWIIVSIAAILFVVLAALPASAGPREDVRILVPESLTAVSSGGDALSGSKRDQPSAQSTTGKKIVLVGYVERGKAEMEIVNGFSRITPVFHEKYFHAQVMLSLGVNIIEVRWRRAGGAWNTKSVSIFRASKLEGGISGGNYPQYTFHKPEKEEHCQECHQMGLTRADVQTGMERSCMKCHSGLTNNIFVHGPVGAGVCTACHDPESSPNRYKVQENDDVLCYSCHDDRQAIDSAKRLLHGPVGAKLCTICHDPHSSPFQYQLIKSRNEVCVMCHQEDYDRWIHEKSLHPPFKEGDCAGCHDPHSADHDFNLKGSRKDVCALCHEIPVPGHIHEAGGFPRFSLPENFPLSPEGRIMCLTCHDPHGAPGDKLTRKGGCDGCHQK